MKLSDLTLGSLEIVQGVEKRLTQRRRRATTGALVAASGIVLQVVLAAADPEYAAKLDTIGTFVHKLWRLDFAGLFSANLPQVIGALLLIGGLIVWATLRWTAILLRESEDCFRYSFQVADFNAVNGTPAERCKVDQDDRLQLLSRDLTERLNNRIRRLSILNADALEKELDERTLSAHIHIDGWYVVRETEQDKWVVQVTSNIRIGGKTRASTQTTPVRYTLKKPEKSEKAAPDGAATDCVLTADDYNQLVERVYSRVATEVYRQIEDDIREKMRLFPTPYRRAVALSAEAEDFARSNTIDAYDRALELYRAALRHFNIANIGEATRLFLWLPVLWRTQAEFVRRKAAVVTGYARCIVYRRKLSALTGRYRNSMFEVPGLLNEVVRDLEWVHQHISPIRLQSPADSAQTFLTFPRDLWRTVVMARPGEMTFARQRKALFDALVARALAHQELGAFKLARRDLEYARSVDPVASENDPLYMLTAAELDADLDRAIRHAERAVEIDPEFQIARFRLAYYNEMRFRNQDDLSADKAERVLAAYDDVLALNPGNIAVLAAQGYLYWLLGDVRAQEKFEQGIDLKNIVEETFVGELNYGLARVAVERASYSDAYDHYMQAIVADPGVAAYVSSAETRSTMVPLEYIGGAMLTRFTAYTTRALGLLNDKVRRDGTIVDSDGNACSPRTVSVLRSFLFNDFGNACYYFQFRHGTDRYLKKAIEAYEKAAKADASNAVAHYNLALARTDNGDPAEKVTKYLQIAQSLVPTWPVVRTTALQTELKAFQNQLLALSRPEQRPARASDAPAPTDQPSEKRVHDLQSTLASTIIKPLRDAISETRFGLMVNRDAIDYAGGAVNTEAFLQIQKDRLNENDLEVLKLWAEVLWTNVQSEGAARAAQSLAQLHGEYYPEDFNRSLLIANSAQYREMWRGATAATPPDGPTDSDWPAGGGAPPTGAPQSESQKWFNKQLRSSRSVLVANVKRWLDEDPIHCGALLWLTDDRLNLTFEERLQLFEERRRDTAGCLAQRGRIYSAAKKWDESIRYLTEATALDEEEHLFHYDLSWTLQQADRFEEACVSAERARKLDPGNPLYESNLKLAYNNWGNFLYAEAEYEDAAVKYQMALDVDPSDKVITSNRALALEELGPARLDETIIVLQRARDLDPANTEYATRLDSLRSLQRAISFVGFKAASRTPEVVAILVEVAADLVPHVELADELSPAMKSKLSLLRSAVETRFGVKLPRVIVRANESDFPFGTYQISIWEVPVATGSVSGVSGAVGMISPASASLRAFARLGGETAGVAASPEEKDGGDDAALDEIIAHLFDVVSRNLDSFVGMNETYTLVEDHASDRLERVKALPDGMLMLTRVLRALLAEVVPITPFAPLVDLFLSGMDGGLPLPAIIDSVRLSPDVLTLLPGNAPIEGDDDRLFKLDAAFESAIRQSLTATNGRRVLEIDAAQRYLMAVRNSVSGGGGTIVVADPAIRLAVRKLVEDEFPVLHVLSKDELSARWRGKEVKPIAL